MQHSARSRRREVPGVGLPLNYPRAGVSSALELPEGWRSVTATARVDGGLDLFDRVSDRLRTFEVHDRIGMRSERIPCRGAQELREVHSGPLRGLVKVVDVVDEVDRQGIVLGTCEGNPQRAEHRAIVDYDVEGGGLAFVVTTAWIQGRDFLLPGATAREEHRHRRLVERVAGAMTTVSSPR